MKEHAPGSVARVIRWSAAIVVAVVVATVGMTGTALANFPHFTAFSVTVAGTPGPASLASGQATTTVPNLQATWAEAGLGPNTGITYQLQTMVTATFGCVNGGSQHPSATNKTTVTEPVTASATLFSDMNGHVSGSVVVPTSSVSPPPGFSCPSGQTQDALSATFADIMITDPTHNVSDTVGNIVVTLGP